MTQCLWRHFFQGDNMNSDTGAHTDEWSKVHPQFHPTYWGPHLAWTVPHASAYYERDKGDSRHSIPGRRPPDLRSLLGFLSGTRSSGDCLLALMCSCSWCSNTTPTALVQELSWLQTFFTTCCIEDTSNLSGY